MAGDWIKVEEATVDKPEVLALAELFGWDRRQALGLLIEFWCWLDKNLSEACPDFVRHMSRKSLDEVMHVPGFSSALEAVGWAKFDDKEGVLRIPNADRHNGTPAKTRALDAKRKKKKRLENVQKMSGSKTDINRTREEKRREEVTTGEAKASLGVSGEEDSNALTPTNHTVSKNTNGSGQRAAAERVLEFLNEKAGKAFQPTDVNVDLIVARMKEGYTEVQCRQVVVRKVREWLEDDQMAKFIRPATLFNREKFNQYAGELVVEGGGA